MGLDLILYWKTCNYRKVILLNLKMSLCAWWPIFLLSRKTLLFKIYFKSLVYSKQNAVVLRFEIVSDIKLSVTPVFTVLILLFFFSSYQNTSMSWFHFYYFFLFLTATNALAASWVSFSNTRILLVFFLSEQKDKNTFKDNSQWEYFIY